MKRVLVLFMVAALATVSQAVLIDSFVNLDFDSGVVTTWPFKGFDAPDATEIIGWSNYRDGAAGPLNDAGVEGPSAWWLGAGYVYGNAAFMSSGDAAYNMSTYIIQADDVFTVSYMAGVWGWIGPGQWTATLFYDTPANVIGTYVQNINSWLPDGVWYSDSTGIPATPESVGGTLGVLFQSTDTGIVQIDEIAVSVVPEPATLSLLGLGVLTLVRKRK